MVAYQFGLKLLQVFAGQFFYKLNVEFVLNCNLLEFNLSLTLEPLSQSHDELLKVLFRVKVGSML